MCTIAPASIRSRLPAVLGREAAGVVAAKGKKVRDLQVGDRVAYVLPQPGAYSELRNVPAARVVKVPNGISDEQAAAHHAEGHDGAVPPAPHLSREARRFRAGARRRGRRRALLSQWAKSLGATVIGVVGSDAKAELARKHGCKHVLISGRDEIAPSVKKLTKGVASPWCTTRWARTLSWNRSIRLRPLGMMVSFGNASGPPPAFNPLELSQARLAVSHAPHAVSLHRAARGSAGHGAELFAAVKSKTVRVQG